MSSRFRCIGLGEVLWDLLPAGARLGGAPANFAYHCAGLGASAQVISRVGRDPRGDDLVARLTGLGLPTDTIQRDPAAPTGTVSVDFDGAGQPRYTIHAPAAWDALAADPAALAAVGRADAICFGTLAQRDPAARAAIGRLLAASGPQAVHVFDVNLRQDYYSAGLITESLALADVLKVNDAELPRLVTLLDLPAGERAALAALAVRFGLRAIAYTRGAEGSLVYAGGRWHDEPARPVKVADPIGAGDSFTAAFTLGLLAGWALPEVCARATAVAAYVCSQPGATPELPTGLTAPFRALNVSG